MTKLPSGVVVTGAAGAGKTTLIRAVEQKGYPVLHEISTELIQEGVFHPLRDRHAFQQELLRLQLDRERQLFAKPGPHILDRGALDGVVHYIIDGLEVPGAFAELDLSHYAVVLLIEHLGIWQDDGVRFEDMEFVAKYEPLVERVYQERGFQVVRVPKMEVEPRTQFVLDQIRKFVPPATAAG